MDKPEANTLLPHKPILYDLPSIVDWLQLEHLFASAQPLHVELGSGDGSFLVRYAQAHPGWNFIGVERLLGRLKKLDRKARRAGLVNIRGIRIESWYFLKYLLPPHSAEALHIYFPDPWPKRRHRHHRLINESFPDLAARVLSPAGTVFLRTDDTDYFTHMRAVFAANSNRFEETTAPTELLEHLTDFQRDFQAQGIPTLQTAFTLSRT